MLARFRALSQERQLAMAAVVMLLLILLIGGAWLVLREPYRALFTGLRSADAAAVVDELNHRHTPYRLADGGTTILIPADQVDATRLALANGNLSLKGTVGFELFNKSDMGLTDFAQRINYQRALQGELERTIMSLGGVEESRVHLSLGEDRLFREDRVAPKASVTIRMHGNAVLAPGAASGIQRLIAAAVPQLEAADVVILDGNGQVLSPSAATPTAPLSPEAAEQSAIATYYAARIRSALERSYPIGQIRVAVHAGIPHRRNGSRQTEWNPAARAFPLEVVLEPANPLDEAARKDIYGLAARAIDFNAMRGDAIDFGTIEPTPAALLPTFQPTASTPPRLKRAGEAERPGDPAVGVLATVAGILLVLITVVLLRGRASRRSLTAVQRSRLASQLNHLLNEDNSDGLARS